MNKIELLAPAGDLQRLKTAVRYGADAVYIGGRQFSLRSRASNFTLEDIREGAAFAREHGAAVHVTVNMLPHEDDFDGLKEYVEQLCEAGGHLYGVNGAGVTQEYIADVIAYDEVTQTALLQVKNHFRPHIEAEVFGPHTPSTRFEIGDVCDLEGRPLEVLNQPMQMVRMKCSLPLEEHAMIRKVYDRSGRHVY